MAVGPAGVWVANRVIVGIGVGSTGVCTVVASGVVEGVAVTMGGGKGTASGASANNTIPTQ